MEVETAVLKELKFQRGQTFGGELMIGSCYFFCCQQRTGLQREKEKLTKILVVTWSWNHKIGEYRGPQKGFADFYTGE